MLKRRISGVKGNLYQAYKKSRFKLKLRFSAKTFDNLVIELSSKYWRDFSAWQDKITSVSRSRGVLGYPFSLNFRSRGAWLQRCYAEQQANNYRSFMFWFNSRRLGTQLGYKHFGFVQNFRFRRLLSNPFYLLWIFMRSEMQFFSSDAMFIYKKNYSGSFGKFWFFDFFYLPFYGIDFSLVRYLFFDFLVFLYHRIKFGFSALELTKIREVGLNLDKEIKIHIASPFLSFFGLFEGVGFGIFIMYMFLKHDDLSRLFDQPKREESKPKVSLDSELKRISVYKVPLFINYEIFKNKHLRGRLRLVVDRYLNLLELKRLIYQRKVRKTKELDALLSDLRVGFDDIRRLKVAISDSVADEIRDSVSNYKSEMTKQEIEKHKRLFYYNFDLEGVVTDSSECLKFRPIRRSGDRTNLKYNKTLNLLALWLAYNEDSHFYDRNRRNLKFLKYVSIEGWTLKRYEIQQALIIGSKKYNGFDKFGFFPVHIEYLMLPYRHNDVFGVGRNKMFAFLTERFSNETRQVNSLFYRLFRFFENTSITQYFSYFGGIMSLCGSFVRNRYLPMNFRCLYLFGILLVVLLFGCIFVIGVIYFIYSMMWLSLLSVGFRIQKMPIRDISLGLFILGLISLKGYLMLKNFNVVFFILISLIFLGLSGGLTCFLCSRILRLVGVVFAYCILFVRFLFKRLSDVGHRYILVNIPFIKYCGDCLGLMVHLFFFIVRYLFSDFSVGFCLLSFYKPMFYRLWFYYSNQIIRVDSISMEKYNRLVFSTGINSINRFGVLGRFALDSLMFPLVCILMMTRHSNYYVLLFVLYNLFREFNIGVLFFFIWFGGTKVILFPGFMVKTGCYQPFTLNKLFDYRGVVLQFRSFIGNGYGLLFHGSSGDLMRFLFSQTFFVPKSRDLLRLGTINLMLFFIQLFSFLVGVGLVFIWSALRTILAYALLFVLLASSYFIERLVLVTGDVWFSSYLNLIKYGCMGGLYFCLNIIMKLLHWLGLLIYLVVDLKLLMRYFKYGIGFYFNYFYFVGQSSLMRDLVDKFDSRVKNELTTTKLGSRQRIYFWFYFSPYVYFLNGFLVGRVGNFFNIGDVLVIFFSKIYFGLNLNRVRFRVVVFKGMADVLFMGSGSLRWLGEACLRFFLSCLDLGILKLLTKYYVLPRQELFNFVRVLSFSLGLLDDRLKLYVQNVAAQLNYLFSLRDFYGLINGTVLFQKGFPFGWRGKNFFNSVKFNRRYAFLKGIEKFMVEAEIGRPRLYLTFLSLFSEDGQRRFRSYYSSLDFWFDLLAVRFRVLNPSDLLQRLRGNDLIYYWDYLFYMSGPLSIFRMRHSFFYFQDVKQFVKRIIERELVYLGYAYGVSNNGMKLNWFNLLIFVIRTIFLCFGFCLLLYLIILRLFVGIVCKVLIFFSYFFIRLLRKARL